MLSPYSCKNRLWRVWKFYFVMAFNKTMKHSLSSRVTVAVACKLWIQKLSSWSEVCKCSYLVSLTSIWAFIMPKTFLWVQTRPGVWQFLTSSVLWVWTFIHFGHNNVSMSCLAFNHVLLPCQRLQPGTAGDKLRVNSTGKSVMDLLSQLLFTGTAKSHTDGRSYVECLLLCCSHINPGLSIFTAQKT